MLPIQVLTRHEAGVNCLAVYGNLVFTGSEDKDIKVAICWMTYRNFEETLFEIQRTCYRK